MVCLLDRSACGPEKPQAKPRGITNEQAKELGRLCRVRGVPYSGSDMTFSQAKREMSRLRGRI